MLRNKPHPRVLKSTLRPRLFLAPCPASKIIAPNRESWFFSKRTPEVLTNPLWEVVFCGERGRIKALAEPIFVRGVSPFYDRRTLRPPELEGLRNLPQKFHFPYWGRKGKENKSRYPSKTRQSAAQTSICAAARAGIIQRRICPVARRRKAEYQRRYGAFWRRVRILR